MRSIALFLGLVLGILGTSYGQQFHKMKDLFPEKNLPFEHNGTQKPSVRPLHSGYASQFKINEGDNVYPIGKLPISPGIFAYLWVQESAGKYYSWISIFDETTVKVLNTYNLTKASAQGKFTFKPQKVQNSQIGLFVITAGGQWLVRNNKQLRTWEMVKN